MGRPKDDVAVRLRGKVWYWAVRAKSRWSDYRLDAEFATPAARGRSGAKRVRLFERVRKTGSIPHLRTGWNLVNRVESHPVFTGTATYFYSTYWDLLDPAPAQLAKTHRWVGDLLSRFELFRPSEPLFRLLHLHAPPTMSEERLYRSALKTHLSVMTSGLDVLALLGALFREAYLVGALDTAIQLRDELLPRLEGFVRQKWLPHEVGQALLELSEHRLLHPQLVEMRTGNGQYDGWPPEVVGRPLLRVDENTEFVIANADVVLAACLEAVRAKGSPPEFLVG